MYPSPRSAAALALMWLGLAATAFAAQPNAAPAARAHPPYAGEPSQIPANGKPIVLEVGKGTLIRLSRPASTVFVASPDIADVQIKSPELIYVSAKAPGQTVIYAVDGGDTVLLNAPVRVDFDLSELRQSLNRLVPGTDISVAQAEKARVLAAAVAGAVKGGQVINRLSVETPNQVNLQVQFAEVDSKILKQIGVDWSRMGRTVSFNSVSNQGLTLPTNQLMVGMLSNVMATVDALATEGFVTVLAEPNLTAVSGQTASFLAGGEFPYPVAQPGSVNTNAIITIQFQQFGVQLAFTPTIIDANHLSLKVRPEVSQLDFADAVTISGSLVPALTDWTAPKPRSISPAGKASHLQGC